ncbi:Hypothetical protein SMAX5B_021274, partial [Scophthalmus maximus]
MRTHLGGRGAKREELRPRRTVQAPPEGTSSRTRRKGNKSESKFTFHPGADGFHKKAPFREERGNKLAHGELSIPVETRHTEKSSTKESPVEVSGTFSTP